MFFFFFFHFSPHNMVSLVREMEAINLRPDFFFSFRLINHSPWGMGNLKSGGH